MNSKVQDTHLQEKPIDPAEDTSRPVEQILTEERKDRQENSQAPLFIP